MTAAAWAVCGMILAGCGAYAWSARRRHVPGLPARGRIRLTDEEVLIKFLVIVRKWDETATEPERSA